MLCSKFLSNLFVFSPFSIPASPLSAVTRFCQRINLEFYNSTFLHRKPLENIFIWNLEYFIAVRRDSDGFQIHQKSNVSSKPGLSKTFSSYLTHEWPQRNIESFFSKYICKSFFIFVVKYTQEKYIEMSILAISRYPSSYIYVLYINIRDRISSKLSLSLCFWGCIWKLRPTRAELQ